MTSLGFARIQFTPDLMPSDVTGSSIWNQRDADFEFRPGPIFTNLLLADEISRAPPKTQAALLEAMQERQVTIEGTTHLLARPFLVLATQSPIEYEGSTRCPRRSWTASSCARASATPAPTRSLEVLERRIERREDEVRLEPVVDRATLLAMQQAVEDVHVSTSIGRYIVELVAATRASASAAVGASPRGSLALLKLSRCRAAVGGRDFVTPDDVKAVAIPALAHRLVLKPELGPAPVGRGRRATSSTRYRRYRPRTSRPRRDASRIAACGGVRGTRGSGAAGRPGAAPSRARRSRRAVRGRAGARARDDTPSGARPLAHARARARDRGRRRGGEHRAERDRAGWLEVLLALPLGLEAAGSQNPISVRLGREEERTLALTLRCERWGTFDLGDVYLRARDRLGLFVWEGTCAGSTGYGSTPAPSACSA